MSKPHAARQGCDRLIAVESERRNINPVTAQGGTASERTRKSKIKCDTNRKKDEKRRQDPEGSLEVESTEVLADREFSYL